MLKKDFQKNILVHNYLRGHYDYFKLRENEDGFGAHSTKFHGCYWHEASEFENYLPLSVVFLSIPCITDNSYSLLSYNY